MKKIILKGGHTALVDDEDFDRVNQISWSLHSAGYAVGHDPSLYRSGGPSHKALVLMHRYVIGCKPGDKTTVDHYNHDRLDCRKANLRLGNQSKNMMNRRETIREGFTSKYRGVYNRGGRRGAGAEVSKPWGASYKGKYLGIFATDEAAARARDAAALEAEGPAAQLNFPKEACHV